MNTVFIDRKEVEPLIAATFPKYTGKKIEVRATESVLLHGLNWAGGSRNQYAACSLSGQAMGNAAIGNQAAPWSNPVEGKSCPVPAGYCVIEHCLFCGKDLGLRIYVNPADMPRYLPSGATDLTDSEAYLLLLHRQLTASYRREEARRGNGIDTREYERLVASLKAKGMLTKQGGLTLQGKNLAASL